MVFWPPRIHPGTIHDHEKSSRIHKGSTQDLQKVIQDPSRMDTKSSRIHPGFTKVIQDPSRVGLVAQNLIKPMGKHGFLAIQGRSKVDQR